MKVHRCSKTIAIWGRPFDFGFLVAARLGRPLEIHRKVMMSPWWAPHWIFRWNICFILILTMLTTFWWEGALPCDALFQLFLSLFRRFWFFLSNSRDTNSPGGLEIWGLIVDVTELNQGGKSWNILRLAWGCSCALPNWFVVPFGWRVI